MQLKEKVSIWWGPPKKFSTEFEERKVSWLELFYDLVYVIAISNITHHLAEHLSLSGFIEYTYFFGMIFWGWLNGSLHHDLHGNTGLRTRLMTLWQMMIVAGLVITFSSAPEVRLFNITIALMVMQLYITYMWWSVGIYDKMHRRLNRPYTVFYLASFALLFATLFLPEEYLQPLFYVSLVLNYLPPFVASTVLRRNSLDFTMSASMTERMGLFTIIIFGEVVLGVVNGVSALEDLHWDTWINFGLAVLIVFSLWWLFFTLISDRTCKPGIFNSSMMEILYVPTLMALSLIGVALGEIFEAYAHPEHHGDWLGLTLGLSFSLFLFGMTAVLAYLKYPEPYSDFKKVVQRLTFAAGVLFLPMSIFSDHLSLFTQLIIVLVIILLLILILNQQWYKIRFKEDVEILQSIPGSNLVVLLQRFDGAFQQ